MLTITEQAATLLTATRAQSDVPDDAVLRVAGPADGASPSISLGFVPEPVSGDAVGDAHGMTICVAPEVAPQLDSATLDVVEEQGEPQLVLVPAPEA